MSDAEAIEMYRPVGEAELALVEKSDYSLWPPRLPEQPIFYPVTNERYAAEIAERWNARDGKKGFVTRFRVRKRFVDRYEVHQVGASHHTEWWIPAEDLDELNANIIGKIEIMQEFDS